MTKSKKRMKEEYRSLHGKTLSGDRRAPWCFVIRLARRQLANVTRPLFLLLIVLPALHSEDNVSVLGTKPRWSVLEHYQQTITHDEFSHLINDVYCTHGFASDLIAIDGNTARILINRAAQKFFTLRFTANSAERKPVPRLWHRGNPCHTRRRRNRFLASRSRSTRAISVATGQRWRSRGFKSARTNRFRKAI